jgi:hypothetical protein
LGRIPASGDRGDGKFLPLISPDDFIAYRLSNRQVGENIESMSLLCSLRRARKLPAKADRKGIAHCVIHQKIIEPAKIYGSFSSNERLCFCIAIKASELLEGIISESTCHGHVTGKRKQQ